MKHQRRDFLLGLPGLAGLGLLPQLSMTDAMAQAAPQTKAAHAELLDYWVNTMGVPAHNIPGAAETLRQQSLGAFGKTTKMPGGIDVDYEPLLLFVDAKNNQLIPAQDIPPESLIPDGDAQVQIQMERLRLGDEDAAAFEKYSSAGLLFDTQQQAAAAPEPALDYGTLAWSTFAAILATRKSGSGGKGASDSKSGSKGGSTSSSPAIPSPPSSGGSGAAAKTVSPALQQAGDVHTMMLPNGIGKSTLCCFMKDRKKSAFGVFIDAFSQVLGSSGTFLPLLSLPGIATPAMTAVRTIVARFHTNETEQKILFQSPPMDLICNRAAVSSVDGAIRLADGKYIVIPKGQLKRLGGKETNIKFFDGYVIPKDVKFTDTYEQAAVYAQDISYLSVSVSVKKSAAKAGCKA